MTLVVGSGSTFRGAAATTSPVNVKNRPLQYISIPGILPVFGLRGPNATSCWPDGTGKSDFAMTRKPAFDGVISAYDANSSKSWGWSWRRTRRSHHRRQASDGVI